MVEIGKKVEISKRELKRLYEKEKLSPYKIAGLYGCDYTTIHRKLKKYNIKSMSKNKLIYIPKVKLEILYIKKRLSISRIAKLYGCSQKPIWRKLHKYKIKIRKPKFVDISKKDLINLYKIKNLKTIEIARLYDCSLETVLNKLHKYKIKLHSNTPDIKKDKLYELYIRKKLSINEIAKKYPCSSHLIWRKLHLWKINVRPKLKKIKIPKRLLQEYYVNKMMSSPVISKKLGVSPITVRSRLKEFGIPIRKSCEYKVIKIDKQELKNMYIDKKLSCARISKIYKCNEEVIRERLHRFRIPLRPNYENSIIYEKRNFSGNLEEKSYLVGFRLGDLHVQKIRKNSRTICIRCGTTKQEQLDLIKKLFSHYGGVWIGNPNKEGARRICCHLNLSFRFLLKKEDNIPGWIRNSRKCFFAFLAGYLDAEGHIELDKKNCAKLIVASYDKNILYQLYEGLIKNNIYCLKPKLTREKGYEKKDGLIHRGDTWSLGIYRKKSLLKTFNAISPYLKHDKRVNDMDVALNNIIKRNEEFNGLRM